MPPKLMMAMSVGEGNYSPASTSLNDPIKVISTLKVEYEIAE